jgi:STE24 endopeptidase
MRLSIIWILVAAVAAVAAVAIAWGWSVGREPVPARPSDQTAAVSLSWYVDLPLEPEAATNAYLARIPASMRERGERYSDTRMLAFELRVLTLILATGFICATRMAAKARECAGRVVSRRALVDLAVALQYFVVLYALSLPAEIYATFLRQHRFGFSDQSFGAWLGDSLVNWGVFTAFYMVAVLAIYWFIRRRPTQWVAWAVGVYLVLRATYTLLSPNVIEPLTNNFRPLTDGPQKEQIFALAHANGIKDVAVVTGDA